MKATLSTPEEHRAYMLGRMEKPKLPDHIAFLIILLAAMAVCIGLLFSSNYENDNRLKAIEKALKGDKYLCSVKRKIIKTHINCDLLKNSQEQDNAQR